jgi:hypothetical protein
LRKWGKSEKYPPQYFLLKIEAKPYFCSKIKSMTPATATQNTFAMPFNAAQLELIQLFSEGISATQLVQLRQILIDFRFNRVSDLADEILDKRGWSAADLAKKARKVKRSTYKTKRKQALAA